jgi:sugar phosphate isomerase/epimerase
MRVGVDIFTLRDLEIDPMGALDYASRHGLAGVQFGWLGGPEAGQVRARADSLGLYCEVAVETPNPHVARCPGKELAAYLAAQIKDAAECGWHELHTWCGGPDARWKSSVPWKKQMRDTRRFLKELAPVLRDHGSRLNMEPKGGLSTFDAVEIIEDVGDDVAGVCLDTANVLCFAEDPVQAVKRVAPYTHMTHCKDAIVYFCDDGLRRQVRPPGQGVIEWETILPILAEHSPGLTLSIEDHKWLYDIPIFTDAWHAAVANLTRQELAKTVGLAWRCRKRITSGELSDPDEYEKAPHIDEMQQRLEAARDYLNGCIRRLGLWT